MRVAQGRVQTNGDSAADDVRKVQEKAWEQNPGSRGAVVSLAALAHSHDLLL